MPEVERTLFEIEVSAEQAKADLERIRSKMTEVNVEAAKAGQSLDAAIAKLGKLSSGERQRLEEMTRLGLPKGVIAQTMTQLRQQDQAQKTVGLSAKQATQDIGEMGRTGARSMGFLERATRSATSSWVRYIGHWIGAYAIMRGVRNVVQDWSEAHQEMDAALADFSWRISATGEDIDEYQSKLLQASRITGAPIAALAGPRAQVAGGPELARAAAAQQLFGADVSYWLREGTTDLDAYARAMAEAQMSTKEFAGILQYSDRIAQDWNITNKESIGLLAGLAKVTGATDREAISLAHALTEVYSANQALMRLGVPAPVRVGAGGERIERPLTQVMGDIARLGVDAQRQVAVALGITDRAQQDLFLAALQGWSEVSQVIQDVESDVTSFGDAYSAKMSSIEAKTERVKTAWDGLLTTIGTTEQYKGMLDTISAGLVGWTTAIEAVTAAWDVLSERWQIPEWMPSLFPRMDIAKIWQQRRQPTLPGPTATERAQATAMAQQAPTGPAAWQQFRVQRLPPGVTIERAVAEMERIIREEFVGVFETATGQLVAVTEESIKAERQLTLVLDETGRKAVDIFGPAWTQALSNLRDEMKAMPGRLQLERLRDIEPAQFDVAMRTRLPMWEARLAQVPGMEEEQEWFNFFVGQQDVGRRQLATQTAMQYTLQDILDTEKKQLEGMWNVPAGAQIAVPLAALDLMRWQQRGAGIPAEGFPQGPGGVPTDLMQPVNMAGANLDRAGLSLTTAGVNLGGAAIALNQAAANMVGGGGVVGASLKEDRITSGVNVGAGGVRAGGGGALTVRPYPGVTGPQRPTIVRNEITVALDGRTLTKTVQDFLVRDLRAAAMGRVGGLRPIMLLGFLLPLLAQFFNNVRVT